jgi:hypothetical protein
MPSPNPTAPSALSILRRSFKRRRRGKIAQLPESLREQIHILLDDGLPYADIIKRLGDAGKGLNEDNLSRWRLHDHQDWLEARLLKQAIGTHEKIANNELAKDILRLQMEFDEDKVRQLIQRDGGKYSCLINALARLAVSGCPDEPKTSESAQLTSEPLALALDRGADS